MGDKKTLIVNGRIILVIIFAIVALGLTFYIFPELYPDPLWFILGLSVATSRLIILWIADFIQYKKINKK